MIHSARPHAFGVENDTGETSSQTQTDMSSPYTEKSVRLPRGNGRYSSIVRACYSGKIRFHYIAESGRAATVSTDLSPRGLAEETDTEAAVKALRELVSADTLAEQSNETPVASSIGNASPREFEEWAVQAFDLPREPLSTEEVQTRMSISREASRALVEALSDKDLRRAVRLHEENEPRVDDINTFTEPGSEIPADSSRDYSTEELMELIPTASQPEAKPGEPDWWAVGVALLLIKEGYPPERAFEAAGNDERYALGHVLEELAAAESPVSYEIIAAAVEVLLNNPEADPSDAVSGMMQSWDA